MPCRSHFRLQTSDFRLLSWRGGRRGLVQQQPVQSGLTDSLDELLKINRLANGAVPPPAGRVQQILLLDRRREDDDGEQFGPRMPTYALEHLPSVKPRHLP